MQLLEVKNDIAKIIYNPADNKLLPSDFLLIEDKNQKLVGQILNVYTTDDSNNNIADVRLALYLDKNDNLSYYNGYIPSKLAHVMYITSDEITEMIADSEVNLYLGNLTFHPKSLVKVPMSLVNDRLYIQCDREDNTKTIVQNLVSELYMKKRKIVLLDFDGRYNRIANVPRLTISESFRFPLNIDAFNNILDYDTVDCPLEDKAVIQSIVLELREYIRTLDNKFLPFTLFKNVVINEFSANPISGLMVLRNKLWQYAQEGLFAESKADFDIINTVLQNENFVIIDASKIEEKWHKFTVQTIPKILDKHCYLALSMTDIPMDKRSIVSLYNTPNIIPIVSTSYDCQSRNILKSFCKNQILFKPSKQTEVDEQYGALVHKLNSNDFILYGEAALNLPLIIELKPFDMKTSESIAEQEIRRNVDRIFSSGKSMLPKEAVISEPVTKPISTATSGQYIIDEDFTDEDLDFLDSTREKEITIEDLRAQKAANDSKQGYDLFEPFAETTNVQSDFANNESVIDVKSEEEPEQQEEIQEQSENVQEEIQVQETVQTEENEQDEQSVQGPLKFDFDEFFADNDKTSTEKASVDEEKEEQPLEDNLQNQEEVKENAATEQLQEMPLDVEQQEKVQSLEEEVIEETTEAEQEQEQVQEQEETPKKKKRGKRTRQAVSGYFKNDGAEMDVIPDIPTLETFGDLEFKEEDEARESAADIASVENLSMDDIEGFGFGGKNDGFVEIDENGEEFEDFDDDDDDYDDEDDEEDLEQNVEEVKDIKKNVKIDDDEDDEEEEVDLKGEKKTAEEILKEDEKNLENILTQEITDDDDDDDDDEYDDDDDEYEEDDSDIESEEEKVEETSSVDEQTEQNVQPTVITSEETQEKLQENSKDLADDFSMEEFFNSYIDDVCDNQNSSKEASVKDETTEALVEEKTQEQEEVHESVQDSVQPTLNEELQSEALSTVTQEPIKEEISDEVNENVVEQANEEVEQIATEEQSAIIDEQVEADAKIEEQVVVEDEIIEEKPDEQTVQHNEKIAQTVQETVTETDVEQNSDSSSEVTSDDVKETDNEEAEEVQNSVEEIEEEVIEEQQEDNVTQNVVVEVEEEVIEQEKEEIIDIKPQPKEQKKKQPKEEEIVPINNVIDNIKEKASAAAQKTLSRQAKQQDEAVPSKERKVTKNTPPPPVQITKDRTHKKQLTVYETDTSDINKELPFNVGDRVYHPKHGKGVVEGFANYSNKILFCQIEFENVGRRILDPRISGLEKIN